MANRLITLLALVLLTLSSTVAQDIRTGRLALQGAATAMGVANVKTIQFSGSGWNAAVGQNYSVTEDWPRFEVSSYTKLIDYDGKYSKEDYTRKQGAFPAKGGETLSGPQNISALSLGEFSWNLEKNLENPMVPEADLRQLDIVMSPHGFLKAAIAVTAKGAALAMENGKKVTIVTLVALGKYHVNGTISEDNTLERVQTWVSNPVLGDMLYEYQYSDYKDFGGVKFPTTIKGFQGDPRLSAGHSSMELHVTDVKANVPSNLPSAAPFSVRQAFAPGIMTETQRRQGLIRPVGDKVWLITGGTHSSVVVEFKDFLAVVEAPTNEERSLWVLPEIHRLSPKPIKYVVNTHHHFDHLGGIRTYVAQGASVITHESNKQFYEQVLLYPAPRTVQPDLFSNLYPGFGANRVPEVKTVGATKYSLTDGTRTMDLYAVQGLAHSADMLIAYLPTEKILINAELFSPHPADEPPPPVDASMKTFYDNIQRLKLDVAQHIPIHGVPAPNADFLKILGK